MSEPVVILSLQNVHKSYGRAGASDLEILRGVTLDVRRGETLAVVGASGAGKTTLLNVMGGLDRPTRGSVSFEGNDVFRMSDLDRTRLRSRRIGFVFQAYHLLPELELIDNVLLPVRTRWSSPPDARNRAFELLERVGLKDRATHRPDELSGGEQQRAALARALMNQPDLLLADEPTGNLDSATGEQVLGYLFNLIRDSGCTAVIVTHNPDLARNCTRTLTLRDGALAK